MHQLDVAAGCSGELCNVVTVGGHDFVPVSSEQHDRGVDHVGVACGGEELPSGSSQHLVQWPDVDPAECLSQAGLASAPSPHLPENSAMSEWNVAFNLRGLEPDPHRALVSF